MSKYMIKTIFSFYLVLLGLTLSANSIFGIEEFPEDHYTPETISTDLQAEAVQGILNEAEGTKVISPSTPTDSTLVETSTEPEFENIVSPPGGFTHSPGQEADIIVGEPTRIKRSMRKPVQEECVDFISNTLSTEQTPDDWCEVSFSSGSFTPPSGLDPAMASGLMDLKAEGLDFVYGFLLLDEYLSDKTRQELEALGVIILGPHSNLYKVRLPVDVNILDSVARLPYVEWIGYSTLEQKLSRDLQQITNEQVAEAVALDELPVIINLFDDDLDEDFKRRLVAAGAIIGKYDPELHAYSAAATRAVINEIIRFDFVLFVELVRETRGGHDQSMSTIGADYIRPGWPGVGFDGSSTTLGIMDTGFMLGDAAPTMHEDLNKNGCGLNFTTDAAGVWNDQNGHGTHVLGTIAGTGTANSRYSGVAIGVGKSGANRIRAAKVWKSDCKGLTTWMKNAMDFFDDSSACDAGGPRPMVINISGGTTGIGLRGTDSMSRKLDSKVWSYKQTYVVCVGNNGPSGQTVWTPGVAKNALTVGNVLDNGYLTVGDIRSTSSRGPTGDGRMKPNIVAPGTVITSAKAGTTYQYTDMIGCSMATPHVSGLATTLLQHYTNTQWRPYLLRAHLMATSILHDDVTTPSKNTNGGRNTYGLGRVSSYAAHWSKSGSNGWSTYRVWGTVTNTTWRQHDIEVPSGTERLVVVMTWDEPAASAGASGAVSYDLDLWIDRNADCTPDAKGQCGEYASQSDVDNVEYLIINKPSPGTYRLKAIPWNAPSFGLPVGMVASIIRGDPTPEVNLTTTLNPTNPIVGNTFMITTSVTNPDYIASGVHLALTNSSSGLTLEEVQTTREDDVTMNFGTTTNLTLGNIHSSDGRSAEWTFRANTSGPKTISFRAWSENGGTQTVDMSVTVFVIVPDVVGFDQVSAQSAIRNAGLVVGSVTTAYSSTMPTGSVINQNPPGGLSVAPGSAVDITVSLGLKGDLNGDGCVDRTDLKIILACIRGPGSCDPSYDLNGDGAVNIADARYLVTLFTNPRGEPCE